MVFKCQLVSVRERPKVGEQNVSYRWLKGILTLQLKPRSFSSDNKPDGIAVLPCRSCWLISFCQSFCWLYLPKLQPFWTHFECFRIADFAPIACLLYFQTIKRCCFLKSNCFVYMCSPSHRSWNQINVCCAGEKRLRKHSQPCFCNSVIINILISRIHLWTSPRFLTATQTRFPFKFLCASLRSDVFIPTSGTTSPVHSLWF